MVTLIIQVEMISLVNLFRELMVARNPMVSWYEQNAITKPCVPLASFLIHCETESHHPLLHL